MSGYLSSDGNVIQEEGIVSSEQPVEEVLQ